MNDDKLAESLKLQATIFSDGRLLETVIKSGKDEAFDQTSQNSVWKRVKSLAHPPADNVFLYASVKGDLRVLKQIRWQDKVVKYRRELNMMERVLKEVEPHQKELFVDFIGWFPSKDYIHFVLEYCPYGDISQHPTPMPEVEAWCVCNQLMEGLSVLHKMGIVHRDIKPQNVLIVDLHPIRIKIADFGISKLANKDDAEPTAQPTTKIGTPGYMAPERLGFIEGAESSHTPAVDIWSLGCLVHYILTGNVPFVEQRYNTHDMSYTALEKYCKGDRSFPEEPLARHCIGPSGRCFVQRLLAPLPEDRPQASGQLMMDWNVSLATADGSLLTIEPPETSPLPVANVNNTAPSQELFYLDESELFEYSDSLTAESHMDLPSSELWYLVKSEKGGRLDRDRLRMLLLSRANPNIHWKGYTALHIAARQGAAQTIKELLEYGADPEARTIPTQETALHFATVQGSSASFGETLQLLVERDADIDATNLEGDTVLHLAIRRMGGVDAIEMLLEKGASTELKGRHGRTPLQYAIFLEREELATALLNHKASPDCEDEDGLTPLHLAVKSNKLSISLVELLIENGSPINHENNHHQTPLFVAATYGKRIVIRLLVDNGAECRPHSVELETRLNHAQSRPRFSLRVPWLS